MLGLLTAVSNQSFFHRRLYSTASSALASAMALEVVQKSKCFDGEQQFYTHYSQLLKCKMNLTVYLPPKAILDKQTCPVLYFLNGLTATHENFAVKSGFQRYASKLGLCVVCPDTSPRDVVVPKHELLGPGGGFYIDATEKPWSNHYQMFSYVTKELVELTNKNFTVFEDKQSIAGFSMGGYGALNCFLKLPGVYKSMSAFSPACNPMDGGIGKQALQGFLGNDEEKWKNWDPCVLVENYCHEPIEIFIEQGTNDEWTEGGHLLPEHLVHAAEKNPRVKVIYKERDGYNHSHYYLATFIEEHLKYHAKVLNGGC